jgi:hypothetical protein
LLIDPSSQELGPPAIAGRFKPDIFDISRAVFVEVIHLLNLDGKRTRPFPPTAPLHVLTKRKLSASNWRPVITGRDELPKAQPIEVSSKVLEKVALEGIVAIAIDYLSTEGVGVELKVGLDLLLDVYVSGVKLIPFGLAGLG